MKTGTAQIEVVSVFCPECHEAYDGTRDGSTMITGEDRLRSGQVVECRTCDTKFRLPAIVARIGQ